MISSEVNILVIGDPHFKVAGVPEHDKMCKSIIENAKNRQIDLIVILGDILDRFETIHVSPLTRSIKFLGELIKIAPVYSLIGNHDLKNNKQFLSDEHGFTAFKLLNELQTENVNNIIKSISDIICLDENLDIMNKIAGDITRLNRITIVDKVMSVTIKNQNFIFVPYVPPGRFQEALNTFTSFNELNESNSISCIFCHQEFKGCQMGAIISTEGDLWSVNNPYIISGHMHNYQNLQENILYIGTPIQHTFGDSPNKTISYFNFKSPVDRTEERINLGLIRKATVRIKYEEINKYIPPTNSILRITILGSSAVFKSIMIHPNVTKWEKMGHKVTPKEIPTINTDKNNNIINTAPQKYSIALQKSIEYNPQLQELYNNIFGKKKEDIILINKPKTIVKLKIIK